MANKKGTLTVRVVADTKAAEQGLDRFASKTQTTSEKLDSAGRKMTAFATIPIAAAMGIATKAASDLNETVSKSNTIFGDSADEMEAWADDAVDSIGQSKRQALDAAATFGNLFVQLGVGQDEAAGMSQQMVELASDFASFHNADITQVLEAQTAAFRGEYDAVQRFVPTINAATVEQKALEQSGKATTKELTAQEKALAVQTLLMEDAGDAIGDYSRTQDSAANQTRRAKAAMEEASAEIGQALLPLAADLAGGVADLAQKFGDLPDPIKNGVIVIGGLLAATGPILTMAGNVGKLAGKMKELGETHPAIGKLAGRAAGMAVLGQGLAFAANELADMAGLTNDLSNLNTEMEVLARTGKEIGDVDLDRISLAIDEIIDPSALESAGGSVSRIIGGIGEAVTLGSVDITNSAQQLENELKGVDETLASMVQSGNGDLAAELFKKISDRVEENGHSADDAARAFPGYSAALEVTAARASDAEKASAGAAGATKDAGEAADKAEPKVEDYASAVNDSIQPNKDLEDAIKGVNDALRAQFDPLFTMTDALLENQEAQRSVEETERQLIEAQDELNGAVRDFGRDSPEATEAARRLDDAQRGVDDANRRATRSAIDVTAAANDLAGQMRAGNADIAAAEQQIKQWADQGLITEDQARQMKDELNLARIAAHELDQQDVSVQVSADTRRFWAAISDLYSGAAGVPIGMGAAGGPIVLPPKRHAGGPTAPRSMYLVGGPGAEELLITGNQPGQVLPPSETRRMLSSGGGSDLGPLLAEIRGLRRDVQRTSVNIDGYRAGTMLRRVDDMHALRNAG